MLGIIALLIAALIGFGLILGGVFLLAGLAWTLIGGGALCLLMAAVIYRGVFNVR